MMIVACAGTCVHALPEVPGRALYEAMEPIAGYKPPTDVVQHNRIDLDQAALETALKTPDYAAAKLVYTAGGNSVSKGKFRTIQGFSLNAATKMKEEPTHMAAFKYYGNHDYGDKWVTAAFDKKKTGFSKNGNADFSSVGDDDTRVQAIKKGTVYLDIFPYAIHELEAAINKCEAGGDNTGAIHALDEGVAFYTGTLQGPTGDGSGKLMYALANKRCQNYKTCGGSDKGTATANIKLFKEFNAMKAELEAGKCDGLRPIVDRAIAQGFVPLTQGALRYSYKVGVQGKGLKEAAEGATFAAAVLPRLAACSESDAKTVYDNLRIGAPSTNHAAVKAAFENNYGCMGFSCADIGGLWDADSGAYYEGAEQCFDFGGLGFGAGVGIIVAVVVLIIIAVVVIIKKKKAGKAPPTSST